MWNCFDGQNNLAVYLFIFSSFIQNLHLIVKMKKTVCTSYLYRIWKYFCAYFKCGGCKVPNSANESNNIPTTGIKRVICAVHNLYHQYTQNMPCCTGKMLLSGKTRFKYSTDFTSFYWYIANTLSSFSKLKNSVKVESFCMITYTLYYYAKTEIQYFLRYNIKQYMVINLLLSNLVILIIRAAQRRSK